MDIGTLTQFIRAELLILIPVLWAIGAALKKVMGLDNAWIPFILAAAGMILAILYMFAFPAELDTLQIIITGLIQGILCAALAVFGHQVVTQASNLANKKE